MSEEKMFDGNIVTVADDDGVEHELEIIDTFDKDGRTFVALIPAEEDEDEEEGELVILEIVEEDGEEFLTSLENEEEFNAISEIFMDRLKDVYDFHD